MLCVCGHIYIYIYSPLRELRPLAKELAAATCIKQIFPNELSTPESDCAAGKQAKVNTYTLNS